MDNYNIGEKTPPSVRDSILSLGDLEEWMADRILDYSKQPSTDSNRFDPGSCEVRRYIASSIKYSGDELEGGLLQTGCSPNYFGELWSLACCKHHMRSTKHKFRNNIFGWDATDDDSMQPKKPLFIFTYSRKSGGNQYLASIAMVTRGFKNMPAYRDFLENSEVSDTARDARLTGVNNPTPTASNFGDCHHGPELPKQVHPHVGKPSSCSCARSKKGHAYKQDMNGKHVICVAEPGFWTAWTQPVFETKITKEQNAHGRPLRQGSDESLDHFFVRLLDEDDWLQEVDGVPHIPSPGVNK